jgi:hypothetical protein
MEKLAKCSNSLILFISYSFCSIFPFPRLFLNKIPSAFRDTAHRPTEALSKPRVFIICVSWADGIFLWPIWMQESLKGIFQYGRINWQKFETIFCHWAIHRTQLDFPPFPYSNSIIRILHLRILRLKVIWLNKNFNKLSRKLHWNCQFSHLIVD